MVLRSIPTRAELLQLIADRAKDPPIPELTFDPPWMFDAGDEVRKHIRERERRINRLKTRLHKATRDMEQEFDRNS